MKKIALFLTVTCLVWGQAQAQTTGSFEETISFNSANYTMAYHVPTNYNSATSYPLVVALHGCGGNGLGFRDGLVSISDSLDAIILCPHFNAVQITGTDGQLIPNAIDSTINAFGYNIDTTAVYLTGFSCNGQATFKQGWNDIYPFAGIIPFNSWVSTITPDYNFDSDIPTCICTGDQDGSYQNNVNLYDSLIVHGGIGKLNTMPGIGHVWDFAGRDFELMECFNWIDSLNQATVGTTPIDLPNFQIALFPNPVNHTLNIKNETEKNIQLTITNLEGQVISHVTSNQSTILVNTMDYSNGIYFMQLQTNNGAIETKKFIVQH